MDNITDLKEKCTLALEKNEKKILAIQEIMKQTANKISEITNSNFIIKKNPLFTDENVNDNILSFVETYDDKVKDTLVKLYTLSKKCYDALQKLNMENKNLRYTIDTIDYKNALDASNVLADKLNKQLDDLMI